MPQYVCLCFRSNVFRLNFVPTDMLSSKMKPQPRPCCPLRGKYLACEWYCGLATAISHAICRLVQRTPAPLPPQLAAEFPLFFIPDLWNNRSNVPAMVSFITSTVCILRHDHTCAGARTLFFRLPRRRPSASRRVAARCFTCAQHCLSLFASSATFTYICIISITL